MLGKQRAVEVMEGIGRALGTIVRPDRESIASDRMDRLADAIVGVEYYMELLQAGRPEPWRMLEPAEQSLADLEPGATRVVPLRPRIEEEDATKAVEAREAGGPELPVPAVPAPGLAAPGPEAAVIEQPTLTPTPLIAAVVLPSGHTPPNAPGGTRFNEDEIPEHLRPLEQSWYNAPVPTPGPEQAIRIQIPAIGVDAPIVQGDGWEQLKKGGN